LDGLRENFSGGDDSTDEVEADSITD
jgi:hypothetical protein